MKTKHNTFRRGNYYPGVAAVELFEDLERDVTKCDVQLDPVEMSDTYTHGSKKK